tara:strand:+ start:4796 stop:5158 length:363 start_codon:yes stop_codon:yes gene_type:complete
MRIPASSVSEYIFKVLEYRRDSIEKIVEILRNNIPDGYHCKPSEPLSFISVGDQKKIIRFYLLGVCAMPGICDWFVTEYPEHSKFKLIIGTSCLRLKRMIDILYNLIVELGKKIIPQQWI